MPKMSRPPIPRRHMGWIERRWWSAFAVVMTFAIANSISLCHGAAMKAPDDKLTPGVARTDLTEPQLRTTKWGKDARFVSPALIREVAQRYGITITKTDKRGEHDRSCGSPRCEIDHRLPRCLGGADVADNLSYQSAPYWHRKDRLEDYACRNFVAGKLSLEDARAMFKADWRVAYQLIFGVDAEHDPP